MEQHEKSGGPTEYSCKLQLPCNAPFEKLEGPVCSSIRLAQQACYQFATIMLALCDSFDNDVLVSHYCCRLFVWLLARSCMRWEHSPTCSCQTREVGKKEKKLIRMMKEIHSLGLLGIESSILKEWLIFLRLVDAALSHGLYSKGKLKQICLWLNNSLL